MRSRRASPTTALLPRPALRPRPADRPRPALRPLWTLVGPRAPFPLRTLLAPAAPFALLASLACAGSPPSTSEAPAPTDDQELARLEALYQARADSARMDVSDADARFMTGMIHHHAQALVMAGWAPENGASPSVLTLTSRIINSQTDEIHLMQRWLRERDRPVPEVRPDGHIVGPEMQMAGMLTDEQLDELHAARGPEYDRLFLKYMIQHHQGAVTMVHDLFTTDGAAQDDFVFKLASDIQVDQTTEIQRMQRMLDALTDGAR
jgi:uncharacterized protein (DUF305 family)